MLKKTFFLSILMISSLAFADEKISLALNWKAEPEFGGFYTAKIEGFYKENQLDVQILEGGSGTPTIQMLANGKVDFAIVSADEIIIAQERNPKNKIKALFSVYNQCPHVILTHEERGFKSLQEVFNSTGILSVQSGLPYYQYLVKTWGRPKAKVVPYSGGVAAFASDKNISQQGFLTTELLAAQKAGANVKYFPVSEAGYNPYLVVVAATEKTLAEKPELVKKFLNATRKGWDAYLKDPKKTNQHIATINKAFDLETLNKSAEIQKPLIEQGSLPVGSMSNERWETLTRQLREIGLIKKNPSAKDFFVDPATL